MISSLVNARYLQIKYTRVLHETLLVLILMYSSETMLWKEKNSRIKTVQMDNLIGLLGVRMDSLKCMNKGVVWSDEESR